MKTNKILFMVFASVAFAACSNEEDTAPVEIRFSNSLTAQAITRTDYTLTQDDKLAADQTVFAWVDENTTGTKTYTAVNGWQLTTGTSTNGTLTPYTDGTTSETNPQHVYYPTSGNNVWVYAVHGNMTGKSESGYSTITKGGVYPSSKVEFSVLTVQTSEPNYAVSDLLYIKKDCARQTAAHNLELQHCFSKIEVVLNPDEGMDNAVLKLDEVQSIKILNTKLTADVTFNQNSAAGTTPTIAVTGSVDGTNFNAISAKLTKGNMDLKYGTSGSQTGYCLGEAIIVPQSISASTTFFEVKLKDGGVLKAPLTTATTFVGGNKYIYNVKVGLTELNLTATIVGWGGGAAVTDESARMD